MNNYKQKLQKFWSKFNIREFLFNINNKIMLLGLSIIMFFMVYIGGYILPKINNIIFEQNKLKLRDMVAQSISFISAINDEVKLGIISLESGQIRAKDYISRVRFGRDGKGYLWINDLQPKMVVHPYSLHLIDKDLSNYKDPNGKKLFVEMVKVCKKDGSGYVDYMWQWKDDESRIVPKISYVRLYEPWGWIVGTGVYIDDIKSENKKLLYGFLIVMLIVIIIMIIMLKIGADWVGSAMKRSLGRLAEKVRDIATGNLSHSIQAESNDEIGQLVSDVEQMRISIKDLTENLEAKVEERTIQLQQAMESIWAEIEIARKIQMILLPVQPKLPGFEIAVSLEPADEVGGDYYDIIKVDDYYWLVIGDVSGHGVTAGLVMMMVQTAIHAVIIESPDISTRQLMIIVNKVISANIKRLGETKYMTITVFAMIKDGTFYFSGLHQDILVYRAATSTIDIIETNGMWLGIEDDISGSIQVDSLEMSLGDCMILYTDGITEAEDSNGKYFGDKRLIDILQKSGSKLAIDIHDSILNELHAYKQNDDVALVVLKKIE
ncbi:MAG: SpoIIE family protein phosphatase [bacterium]|nr:SpoIIE family protein phosphatase [bacterium]